jgi:hypothetical protein
MNNPTRQPTRRLNEAVQQVLRDAVERLMAARYPDLPVLAWYLDPNGQGLRGYSLRGYVTGIDHEPAEVAVIAEQWAQALGLRPDEAWAGCVDYAGTVDDLPVTIWGIVDRQAWAAG